MPGLKDSFKQKSTNMGGTHGNPIDEADQARIDETIEDVIKLFSVEISRSFTQAVVEKNKNEFEPESSIEDEAKLRIPPAPSYILKTGTMIKVVNNIYLLIFINKNYICLAR